MATTDSTPAPVPVSPSTISPKVIAGALTPALHAGLTAVGVLLAAYLKGDPSRLTTDNYQGRHEA